MARQFYNLLCIYVYPAEMCDPSGKTLRIPVFDGCNKITGLYQTLMRPLYPAVHVRAPSWRCQTISLIHIDTVNIRDFNSPRAEGQDVLAISTTLLFAKYSPVTA